MVTIRQLIYVFLEAFQSRTAFFALLRQLLILRYRRTVMGYLWTLLNPLFMMSITAVVFSNLFQSDLKTFAIYMFAGMVPWNFFSGALVQSASSFIANEGLIKKIYLPRVLFPLSTVTSLLIDNVFSLLALFVIISFIGGQVTSALLFLPFAYFLLFLFTLGGGLVFSIATVYYRDLQQVISILLQALFFLTPIVYDKSKLVGGLGMVMHLNPLVPFIDLFRAPIRYGQWPEWGDVTTATELAIASLIVGLLCFLWKEKQLVFRL